MYKKEILEALKRLKSEASKMKRIKKLKGQGLEIYDGAYDGAGIMDTFKKLFSGQNVASVLNAVRHRLPGYNPEEVRDLVPGEKHWGLHNYTGPGTQLSALVPYHGEMIEARYFPPYNDIDNCSRTHDLDYERIGKTNMTEEQKREAIKESDIKAVQCYNRYKNEDGYLPAVAGISGKAIAEAAAGKTLYGGSAVVLGGCSCENCNCSRSSEGGQLTTMPHCSEGGAMQQLISVKDVETGVIHHITPMQLQSFDLESVSNGAVPMYDFQGNLFHTTYHAMHSLQHRYLGMGLSSNANFHGKLITGTPVIAQSSQQLHDIYNAEFGKYKDEIPELSELLGEANVIEKIRALARKDAKSRHRITDEQFRKDLLAGLKLKPERRDPGYIREMHRLEDEEREQRKRDEERKRREGQHYPALPAPPPLPQIRNNMPRVQSPHFLDNLDQMHREAEHRDKNYRQMERELIDELSEEPAEEAIKKSPSKRPSLAEIQEQKSKLKETPTKPSQPRKAPTPQDIASLAVEKRGKLKKVDKQAPKAPVENLFNHELTAEIAKRGRPKTKKHLQYEEPTGQGIKKKRGRPKKEVATVKKKPGRLKKNACS